MFRALVGNQKNGIQLSVSHLTMEGLFNSPYSLVLQVKMGLFFLTEACKSVFIKCWDIEALGWWKELRWCNRAQMLPIGRTGGELCAYCLELLRASMSEQRVQ